MKKSLLSVLLLIMGAILVFTIGYNYGKSYNCEIFDNYYNATENLLDSIYIHDEVFMDIIGETDAYCDYMDARNTLLNI